MKSTMGIIFSTMTPLPALRIGARGKMEIGINRTCFCVFSQQNFSRHVLWHSRLGEFTNTSLDNGVSSEKDPCRSPEPSSFSAMLPPQFLGWACGILDILWVASRSCRSTKGVRRAWRPGSHPSLDKPCMSRLTSTVLSALVLHLCL